MLTQGELHWLKVFGYIRTTPGNSSERYTHFLRKLDGNRKLDVNEMAFIFFERKGDNVTNKKKQCLCEDNERMGIGKNEIQY
jgi:hypothetical protein